MPAKPSLTNACVTEVVEVPDALGQERPSLQISLIFGQGRSTTIVRSRYQMIGLIERVLKDDSHKENSVYVSAVKLR